MTTKKPTKKITETKREFKDYNDYLKSDKWKKLREEALSRDTYFCKLCSANIAKQVHHIKYPKDWNNDSVDNLMSVCECCHETIHGLYGGNMVLRYNLSTYPKINQWLIITRNMSDNYINFDIKISDYNTMEHIDINIDEQNVDELFDILNSIKKVLDKERHVQKM